MQQIAFRTDATSRIGTGHFMRCFTLALKLKQRGAQILFICRGLPQHLHDMLVAQGMELQPLGVVEDASPDVDLAHSHWLGVSQAYDAEVTLRALSGKMWDWLIVDHYALDKRWESALRGAVKRIMVIDDLADRQHDCDVLLDQNFYADMPGRYADKVPSNCELLLGPRYVLLRDEFRRLHEQAKPRMGRVGRLLVFFGGVDADNYTGRVIAALAGLDLHDVHVDVVVGMQHPCLKDIQAGCAMHGYVCHVQTNKMAELMAEADIAIGAGGTATWERCCLGLPTLVFCTAGNQRQQLEDAALAGLLYSPEARPDIGETIQRHVRALIENAYLRELISRNCLRTVNGRGVSRIVSGLGLGDIGIRAARPEDSENLFKWRNHPDIRAVSRDQNVIDWSVHQRWFAHVMGDADKMLLIGEHSGSPIGVVRFDRHDDVAEVSIYVVPEKKPSGYGQGLLQSAETWLRENRPEIRSVRAHVLGANERSQRLFSGAGYRVESTYYLKKLH